MLMQTILGGVNVYFGEAQNIQTWNSAKKSTHRFNSSKKFMVLDVFTDAIHK